MVDKSIGAGYPLSITGGGLSMNGNLGVERVLSVLKTRKRERPFHLDYGTPAPIFTAIDRTSYTLQPIDGVESDVEVLINGLIINVSES